MKNNLKKILSAFLLGILVSCSSADNSETVSVDEQTKQQIDSILNSPDGEILSGELENKTVKFLSAWDINPDATGKRVPLELALFQQKYGGKIETKIVSWEERYDQLAYAINGGEGIDFFPASDFDSFPKGAIKDMFVPVDDYIDFSSPLWNDVKEVNDSFLWNDSHYMMCTEVTSDCVIIYNKDEIDRLGFENPVSLYEKGEWNWDTFSEMLEKYCDAENQKFGIDGWYFEENISRTTGVPYISLENGKLINNLRNPDIERVQNYMYSLCKSGCIADKTLFEWQEHPEYIAMGKELFYPCGMWILYADEQQWKSVFGENTEFVPMPKDPETDKYYSPAGVNGYYLVKGGKNHEGAVKFAECKRFSMINDGIQEIADKQFMEDYGWSDKMFSMKNEAERLARENPVFDFSFSVSSDISLIMDSSEYGIRASAYGVPWSETLDSIYDTIDTLIKDVVEN